MDFNFSRSLNQIRLSDEVKTENYTVDINVLGMRDLQSFGLLPIKKPFIQFNIRSLLPPEKAMAVENIKTTPSSAGPNPNIRTLISFSTDLPVNKLFCPKLSCEVYDYICKGVSQPRIGSFVIDIGTIMQEQVQRQIDTLASSDELIRKISEVKDRTEFTGELDDQESLRSSQKAYALAIGYDMQETESAFSGRKLGKKKKRRRPSVAKEEASSLLKQFDIEN